MSTWFCYAKLGAPVGLVEVQLLAAGNSSEPSLAGARVLMARALVGDAVTRQCPVGASSPHQLARG